MPAAGGYGGGSRALGFHGAPIAEDVVIDRGVTDHRVGRREEGSNDGSRGAHGKENPRAAYAVSLRAEPALLVRRSSRRITIMRFRPANIR
jgi:hypothetical protein